MTKAFDILAAQYRPMVLTYLRAVVADEHLAEDLTQETLLAAQRSLQTFEEGGNFGAWLRGIGRNKVLESRRAAARRHLVVDSRIVEGMEEVYELFDEQAGPWTERLPTVRRCIAALNDTLRGAIEAVYARGQTISQAAASLGASFEAVAQRLSRARTLIRRCVQERNKTKPTEVRRV
ncbi:MAG: sigma-70 family RNA polymerase sigma factor [Phycisphaeraceae bacterium]|nr:sigma-70 family RNA polymerase sigma factor [Phycisphaeraceae bacterium]